MSAESDGGETSSARHTSTDDGSVLLVRDRGGAQYNAAMRRLYAVGTRRRRGEQFEESERFREGVYFLYMTRENATLDIEMRRLYAVGTRRRRGEQFEESERFREGVYFLYMTRENATLDIEMRRLYAVGAVTGKETAYIVHIYPNFAVAVFLGFVEYYLHAEVKMRRAVFKVDVLFVGVARHTEIAY